MTTLNDLLRSKYHYLSSDFGPEEDEVVVDAGRGSIQPGSHAGKAVMLQDLFKAGQYVSMDLHESERERLRFVILSVNQEGICAVSSRGEEGFLPWQLMRAALRLSRQVYIDVLSELEELDEYERTFVREEIGRLENEIDRHKRTAVELSAQLDKLESIGKRPNIHSPFTWLQGE